MTAAVRFALSYRSLSDSALISCADSDVADALGVPVDEVEQRQIDHDTTVESIGVDRGDSPGRCFLAAQVLGVSVRSRHGLVDHVMPTRLHNTLMTLVHESAETPDDTFTARRTTAWVPVSELMSPWSARRLVRRPAHETTSGPWRHQFAHRDPRGGSTRGERVVGRFGRLVDQRHQRVVQSGGHHVIDQSVSTAHRHAQHLGGQETPTG